MANDPCALAFGFTGLQLLNQELQDAGLIWIGEVEKVEDVADVPEISIDGDDSKALRSGMGVSSVMRGRMIRLCFRDPAISFPHGTEKVIVPAENIICASCLLAIDVIWGVIRLWQRVVIAQGWIDGDVTHLSFEYLVGHGLLVLDVCSTQLVIILPIYSESAPVYSRREK